LVTPQLIDRTVATLGQDAGAAGVIAAERVADTLKKEAAAGVIATTVSRDGLWAAQTPQVFRIAALRDVVGEDAGAAATDEAMLIEREGWTVLLHESGQPNLKVTTPADLELAELILRSR
jgi:2-C-methyl-D-erythritol 4-phosphate cytidylyltransferase